MVVNFNNSAASDNAEKSPLEHSFRSFKLSFCITRSMNATQSLRSNYKNCAATQARLLSRKSLGETPQISQPCTTPELQVTYTRREFNWAPHIPHSMEMICWHTSFLVRRKRRTNALYKKYVATKNTSNMAALTIVDRWGRLSYFHSMCICAGYAICAHNRSRDVYRS